MKFFELWTYGRCFLALFVRKNFVRFFCSSDLATLGLFLDIAISHTPQFHMQTASSDHSVVLTSHNLTLQCMICLQGIHSTLFDQWHFSGLQTCCPTKYTFDNFCHHKQRARRINVSLLLLIISGSAKYRAVRGTEI